ncbi:MAG: hypothetical protein KGJ23_12070 [Euryarchaeota archaeon]|nr:hypothetical protein [Euryarchaeota archaeon]MDE1881665.1 hypothetical protein [Euryarchaeota archaeon]
MERKAVPSLLGAVGGLLLIVGGIVSFILGAVYAVVTAHAQSLIVGIGLGILAGVLGLLTWVMTYYARGTPGERIVGGVTLIVLGIVGWGFLTGSLIALVGATLAFFAGLIFSLEWAVPRLTGAPRPATP